MKKVLMGIAFLLGVVLVLTACGKTSKDKLQGEWKADNGFAKNYIGETMTIKKNNVKVTGEVAEDSGAIKYFNFKDKDDDEAKHIRLYAETPKEDVFDKDNPMIDGVLHFEDDNTLTIEGEDGAEFKFTKE
ncbi:hypothetical protein HMPREF2586_00045 [Staphylococcus sp. HMSC034G07]|uniref:hypothetical protein n=1 Tax=Staphylococcus sp. HMSC034G07 TaxID=1715065 RepID=UPI0008A9D7D8|nr:hypothetical protein [Staphylococcus sp. HMSC034G07]OHO42548.1 hypothetical protein HMPREF2586_00045 [Staphylococcus sp. HMSC034G07]